MTRPPHVERVELTELFGQVDQALGAEFEHLHVIGKVALIFLLFLQFSWIIHLLLLLVIWIVRNELERRGNVKNDIEVAKPAFLEELNKPHSIYFTIVLFYESVEVARAL